MEMKFYRFKENEKCFLNFLKLKLFQVEANSLISELTDQMELIGDDAGEEIIDEFLEEQNITLLRKLLNKKMSPIILFHHFQKKFTRYIRPVKIKYTKICQRFLKYVRIMKILDHLIFII